MTVDAFAVNMNVISYRIFIFMLSCYSALVFNLISISYLVIQTVSGCVRISVLYVLNLKSNLLFNHLWSTLCSYTVCGVYSTSAVLALSFKLCVLRHMKHLHRPSSADEIPQKSASSRYHLHTLSWILSILSMHTASVNVLCCFSHTRELWTSPLWRERRSQSLYTLNALWWLWIALLLSWHKLSSYGPQWLSP